jgi:hypothetical protein
MPIEFSSASWTSVQWKYPMKTEDLVITRAQQIAAAQEWVEEAINRRNEMREKEKERWDTRHRARKQGELVEGDFVLLRNSALEKQWSRKFDRKWFGPYRIIEVKDGGVYRLADMDGTLLKDSVAGSRLKPFYHRVDVDIDESGTNQASAACVMMPRQVCLEASGRTVMRGSVPAAAASALLDATRLAEIGMIGLT